MKPINVFGLYILFLISILTPIFVVSFSKTKHKEVVVKMEVKNEPPVYRKLNTQQFQFTTLNEKEIEYLQKNKK